MSHALIIDDNMIVSRAVQSRLEDLGFTSFDLAWSEAQALAAAGRRLPDLIVLGDNVESGSGLRAAQAIASGRNIPVLMVTGDAEHARRRLGNRCTFEGPFLLNQIEAAVALAAQPH